MGSRGVQLLGKARTTLRPVTTFTGSKSTGLPQGAIVQGSSKKYRSGPWNGIAFPDGFEGAGWIQPFVYNETDVYFSYHSSLAVFVVVSLNHSGTYPWLMRFRSACRVMSQDQPKNGRCLIILMGA